MHTERTQRAPQQRPACPPRARWHSALFPHQGKVDRVPCLSFPVQRAVLVMTRCSRRANAGGPGGAGGVSACADTYVAGKMASPPARGAGGETPASRAERTAEQRVAANGRARAGARPHSRPVASPKSSRTSAGKSQGRMTQQALPRPNARPNPHPPRSAPPRTLPPRGQRAAAPRLQRPPPHPAVAAATIAPGASCPAPPPMADAARAARWRSGGSVEKTDKRKKEKRFFRGNR